MAIFVYRAFDPQTGQTRREKGEFQSLEELFRHLQLEGYILLDYRRSFSLPALKRGLSRPELAEFCRHLALLLRSGVPLIEGLRDLERLSSHKALKQALGRIIRQLNEGRSFSETLAAEKGLFAPVVQALIRVGEETGRLEETLEKAAEHIMRVHTIINHTKRAMLYPLFVLLSMGGALAFWIFVVLPRVVGLFQEFGEDLPLATRVLISIVKNAPSLLLPGLMMLGGLVIFFFFLKRLPQGRLWLEKIFLNLPILGRIKRLSNMAFFFEYLSLLLQAGIELPRIFQIVEETQGSPTLNQIAKHLRERILQGFSLAAACEETKLFNPLELRMIRVGEETGRLVEQFRYLADYYYETLGQAVEVLGKVLEPVLIIMVGLLFLALAVALLGPIYDLVAQLGSF